MTSMEIVQQEKAACWLDEQRMVEEIDAHEETPNRLTLDWFVLNGELSWHDLGLYKIIRQRVKRQRLSPSMRGVLERIYGALLR
jgi:hypothetical protein